MIKLGNVSQNYTKRPPREGPILETSESLHRILDLRGRSGRQAARFQGITLVVDMMLEKTKTNLVIKASQDRNNHYDVHAHEGRTRINFFLKI